MNHLCRSYVIAVEDYLDCHPGELPGEAPPALGNHPQLCRHCRHHWATARASRQLLTSLTEQGGPAADEFFFAHWRARNLTPTVPPRGLWHWEVGLRHLVLAGALFAATLGSFAYNLHRVETPNVDEAVALDVPHLNPQHPYDSHVRPRLADAMLNLMNP